MTGIPPKNYLSSLGLKVLHTVQYVVGLEPTDKVLQKNRDVGLDRHKSRLHMIPIEEIVLYSVHHIVFPA
jgi:hypothetical protein